MVQYTDTDFGFSFWYPAAWKLTDEPAEDPTRHGWFADGKIVKQLQIRNPNAYDDDQPPGVMVEELLAPAGLTELGRSHSPSPVGVDGRYFFDSKTHRWMYEQMTEAPDGAPPVTSPVEIEQTTMGGLPIFPGAVRGGAEVIVPLDKAHFLAVSVIYDGGPVLQIYLAKTVVALRPGAGKRARAQVQAETIRREAVKLRAIGESLVFWYKDSQYVYNFEGEVLRGADPKTFVLVPHEGTDTWFATDGVRLYMAYSGLIPGADPKTFVVTGSSTAKDAHHTYDWSSGRVKID
jgi:hypothetical protein